MRTAHPTLPPGQPDPVLVQRLLFVQRAFLVVVLLGGLAALFSSMIPAFGAYPVLEYVQMSTPAALEAVFCAMALLLTEPGHPIFLALVGRIFAGTAALLAVAILLERFAQVVILPSAVLHGQGNDAMWNAHSPQFAVGFLAIAIVLLFVGSMNVIVQHVADVLVIFLSLLMCTLASQSVFSALKLFGMGKGDGISTQVLGCLLLLTAAVVFRQTDCGVLSIFVGRGIGSRIARTYALILLAWPFLGRIADSRIKFPQWVPGHFAAPVLTSVEVVLSIALLLIVVWQVTEMEKEVHDLTLRDDLTGLMNMRGFYLLADQTYRLAKRGHLPFSVLFMDMDGLKLINDKMGHSMGSAYLKEAGELVHENFRDGDVKGRFGGDEFVVAGQFSMVGIEVATQRLRAMAAERNAKEGRKYPLAFSIGHVTVEPHSTETLKELVAQADALMYKDKQARKAARK